MAFRPRDLPMIAWVAPIMLSLKIMMPMARPPQKNRLLMKSKLTKQVLTRIIDAPKSMWQSPNPQPDLRGQSPNIIIKREEVTLMRRIVHRSSLFRQRSLQPWTLKSWLYRSKWWRNTRRIIKRRKSVSKERLLSQRATLIKSQVKNPHHWVGKPLGSHMGSINWMHLSRTRPTRRRSQLKRNRKRIWPHRVERLSTLILAAHNQVQTPRNQSRKKRRRILLTTLPTYWTF